MLLAVRDQGEALLVERLSALDASSVRYRVGGRLLLASTGVGLVLLAFAPPTVQDQVIASTTNPETGTTTSVLPPICAVRSRRCGGVATPSAGRAVPGS